MRKFHWLRNVVRNRFKETAIGKTIVNLTAQQRQSICFVSATRMNEKDFWSKSLLGRSLRPRLNAKTVTCRVHFENTRGLPSIYNEAIHTENYDILVFLHDDVWLADTQLIQKISSALRFNDIVGVAGNTRRVLGQPAWLFLQGVTGNLEYDGPHLSGAILHGTPESYTLSNFGPHPAKCELMDGVFLATNRKKLIRSDVQFDEKFKFHFYDMDFCRTARASGLSLTTWPIELIHQSQGAFGGDTWDSMKIEYFKKWKS